ncbi:DUF4302 domain-containing protein [Pedobacter sp. UBA4863]|uniref:DUF4302 domain-containing protein n=1 Tax=Pedobacter sp. UBA4863 TaxID=1947060 RepID=UPI0025DEDF29|nr:DUF4302 domain-containing protein [Pedobacter sp. UBA4863]
MKAFQKYLNGFVLATLIFFTACKKEVTVLPAKEVKQPLTAIQASYKKLLVAETAGWYISYKPADDVDEISVWMKFLETDSLTLLAGYSEFHVTQNKGSYSFGGQVTTELVFSNNTLWKQLELDHNGAVKFKITLQENGTFKLRRADGFDDKEFILKKATSQDLTVLQNQIEVVLIKIEAERELQRQRAVAGFRLATLGADNPGFYFQNLTVDNFSAYWSELDTVAKKFTLKWKEGILEKQGVFEYSLIPKGIALKPALVSGGITIDNIIFKDYTNHAIEIESAGNAGAGSWGHKHIPAYPYQNAIAGAPIANYTTVDFFLRGELPRYLGYTLEDVNFYYSPALQVHREKLKQIIGATHDVSTVFRLQFYNYNMNANGTTAENVLNSLQILTKNTAGANVFLAYYYNVEKKDANHVVLTFNGGTSTVSAPFKTAVEEFMEILMPAEGVTVVPTRRTGNNQFMRLVSRKDSRIWVELLSTPTGIYFN